MGSHPKGLWVDLKELRTGYGWTQRQAAEKLGISRSYLSILETSRQAVSANVLQRAGKVFGLDYGNSCDPPE